MTTAADFKPGDRVQGSWDRAFVVEVDVPGNRVLIEWEPVDAVGVDRGPGRQCWRLGWTIRHVVGP